MGKKKGNSKPHPTKSFDQYVAEATLTKFRSYIDSNIQGLGRALMQQTNQQLTGLVTRLIVLEELLIEKYPEITKETLAIKVAEIEDRLEGFKSVSETDEVTLGDRVRVEIRTKKADDSKWENDWQRFLINDTGSGNTLGKELEESILGLRVNETRTVLFGQDHSLEAEFKINKISRKEPQKEEKLNEEVSHETTNAR